MHGSIQAEDLITLCESRAERHFDDCLFSFLDRNGDVARSITYGRLHTRARSIGATLQALGHQQRPVLLWYAQDASFVEAFYGAIFGGAVPMPLSKPRGDTWHQLEKIIAVSGAKIILTVTASSDHFPTELREKYGLQMLCTDAVDSALASDWVKPPVDSRSTAFVQYTSGSTSNPKGVLITHGNVMHNAALVRKQLSLTSQDVGVSWLPFFHDMGLINHVIQPLYSCIHNYHLTPMHFAAKPSRWLDAISRYKATISGGPNFAYELCLAKITEVRQFDLSNWRAAYCGSERVASATLTAFQKAFNRSGFSPNAFFPCYGLAESTLFVCGTNRSHSATLPGGSQEYMRVGDLEEDNAVVVVDPGTGRDVQPDEVVGEIWVKSPSVARGYYEDANQTEETFGRSCAVGDGYLRTGDLGFTHAGGLYFVGRLKNLLKIRGRAFFAEDIEIHITRTANGLGVQRCAAFSIDKNNSEALVILIEDHASMNHTAALAFVRSEICNSFNLDPDTIRITPKHSLPITTSGKLQRGVCRSQFIDGVYDRT